MSYKIPVPITFNPYKHHFHFLIDETGKWQNMSWDIVKTELLTIGNNLIDFYLGDLSIDQICKETIDYFSDKNIENRDKFIIWLNAANYKKIMLSDQSEWLIKEGVNPERYIHVHPAKYSAHTIRVRATTLKTVIALQTHYVKIHGDPKTNLNAVNNIRIKMLGLSPIKSLKPGTGILRLWELFEKGEQKNFSEPAYPWF